MKISVFGLGYVGLANALVLGQHEAVMAYDIVDDKIEMLQEKRSPLVDADIIDFLTHDKSQVEFTTDFEKAVMHGDYLLQNVSSHYKIALRRFILITPPYRMRSLRSITASGFYSVSFL